MRSQQKDVVHVSNACTPVLETDFFLKNTGYNEVLPKPKALKFPSLKLLSQILCPILYPPKKEGEVWAFGM